MRLRILIVVLLLAANADAASGAAARTIAGLERHSVPVFHVPMVTKRTLANGMRCFFREDHTLPLFTFRILIPTGSIFDPPNRVGLNGLMLNLLRTGGSRQHRAAEIDTLLDRHAINVSVEGGMELSSLTVSALSTRQEEALSLLTEMLFTPAFAPERLALTQGKMYEALRRQNDNPGGIAEREFRKDVYGATSPWARTPTRANIERIVEADLRAAQAVLMKPHQFLCAAAGDIHPDRFVATLNRLLAAHTGGDREKRPVPIAPPKFRAETRLIAKPAAAAQSTIIMGHRGSWRSNPDRYAILVMNEILGSPSTLSNWLTNKIRTERGLAYSIWSVYGFGPQEAPGLFQIQAKTRPEKVGEVIQLVRETVATMAEGSAVTQQALDVMKASLLKRIIFEYEEPFNVVAETARFVYFGFPDDYLERYRRGIEAVTLDDVRRVAKQYLHPEALQTLIVGDPKRMGHGLKAIGPRRRSVDGY